MSKSPIPQPLAEVIALLKEAISCHCANNSHEKFRAKSVQALAALEAFAGKDEGMTLPDNFKNLEIERTKKWDNNRQEHDGYQLWYELSISGEIKRGHEAATFQGLKNIIAQIHKQDGGK